MKTSLSHLPQNKQDQLKALTKIVLDKVEAEMIILFGSYARGDWVEVTLLPSFLAQVFRISACHSRRN